MRPVNKEGWYDLWGDNRDQINNDRFFNTLEIIVAALIIGFLAAFIIKTIFIV